MLAWSLFALPYFLFYYETKRPKCHQPPTPSHFPGRCRDSKMAEPPNSDSGVESNTEEGADLERERRRQAALLRRAVQEAYSKIPTSLYDKARDQGPLTEEERQVFLDLGDVLGRVIAYPDSATADDIHEACAWPPPDVVRANIQHATGGMLSTPTELYAKATAAFDRGEFDALISDDEALLIVNNFYARDDDSRSRIMAPHAVPGFGHALTLLSRRLGLDMDVFKAAWTRRWEVMQRPASGPPAATTTAAQADPWPTPAEQLAALASTQEQFRLGALSEQDYSARMDSVLASMKATCPPRAPMRFATQPVPHWLCESGNPLSFGRCEKPSQIDLIGLGPWPYIDARIGGCDVFGEDTGLTGCGLHPAWSLLSEDQKEAYRVQAEARRREAWARFEQMLAQRAAGSLDRLDSLSPFEVFHDELVAGGAELGFWEVLARWEALPNEQRGLYHQRAKKANNAAGWRGVAAAKAALASWTDLAASGRTASDE